MEQIKKSKKANISLNKARAAKNDEFYTQLCDVEKELENYKDYFKGKTIIMPCNDICLTIPQQQTESQFWVYFHKNFKRLGLKKIIATTYDDWWAHTMEYTGWDDDDVTAFSGTMLDGNGDFRSQEVKKLIDEADFVVTNPPFSLFREFIAQLEEQKKKYLVVGSTNAITYKETFRLIKANKLWLGINALKEFTQPDGTIKKFGNINWYTNIKHKKRNEELVLYEEYNPEKFPTYDTYDAISVDKTKEIPKDYFGKIGVPISFLGKWNPDQFEIIGLDKIDGIPPAIVNGVNKYRRLIIKRKT